MNALNCKSALMALALAASGASALAATAPAAAVAPAPAPAASAPTADEIVARSPASDWHAVAPDEVLQMTLPQGQVYIQLAPRFAPRHVANIRTLAHEGYFNGLSILRVQDNYVTQWGDPHGDEPEAKPLGAADTHLPAEFSIAYHGIPFDAIKERDGWSPVSGYVDSFPAAADPNRNQAWLAHCYGAVGAARNAAPDTSNGTDLYAVIGQAPRALDLNITLVGRVLRGMDLLSALQRGSATLGFYDKPEQLVELQRVVLLSDLPEAERPKVEVLNTESATWRALLRAKRHRSGWFVRSPERVDLCGIVPPARVTAAAQ